MSFEIRPATAADADAIAALHAASWRSAYSDFLPASFLNGPVDAERRETWRARFAEIAPDRWHVLGAVANGELIGFACLLLDAEPAWGVLLDNLHVRPVRKGHGVGGRLFDAARRWVGSVARQDRLHLWVIEGNRPARLFYERRGGEAVERAMVSLPGGVEVPEIRYVWRVAVPVIDATA